MNAYTHVYMYVQYVSKQKHSILLCNYHAVPLGLIVLLFGFVPVSFRFVVFHVISIDAESNSMEVDNREAKTTFD